MYTYLRTFLRYCELDPAKLSTRAAINCSRRITKKKPDQYTKEQVTALIDAALDENEALLWDFAYKVGPRDSELKMITRDDLYGLDAKEATVHIRRVTSTATSRMLRSASLNCTSRWCPS